MIGLDFCKDRGCIMAESHVVSALGEKQAEIAGFIARVLSRRTSPSVIDLS
jgi:hypothetical protein